MCLLPKVQSEERGHVARRVGGVLESPKDMKKDYAAVMKTMGWKILLLGRGLDVLSTFVRSRTTGWHFEDELIPLSRYVLQLGGIEGLLIFNILVVGGMLLVGILTRGSYLNVAWNIVLTMVGLASILASIWNFSGVVVLTAIY